jgi:hypothetical protein
MAVLLFPMATAPVPEATFGSPMATAPAPPAVLFVPTETAEPATVPVAVAL